MTVMILHGNSKDYVGIRSREILQEYRANGYEIRELSPKGEVGVHQAFQVGLFDLNPILVVVEDPTKILGLKPYLSDTRGCEVLVLYPKDALPKLLQGYLTQKLSEPKYEDQKIHWCVDFVKEYAQKNGKKISPELCQAIVAKVGLDLGILKFEVLKYAMLAGEEEEITAKMVVGFFNDMASTGQNDLILKVVSRDIRGFIKTSHQIEKNCSTDQTMAVCNGLLFYTLRQLFDIAVRVQANYTIDQICKDLGKNPWYVENKLMPQVRSLGLETISLLIEALYISEDSVLKGVRKPWEKFKTEVLQVL